MMLAEPVNRARQATVIIIIRVWMRDDASSVVVRGFVRDEVV